MPSIRMSWNGYGSGAKTVPSLYFDRTNGDLQSASTMIGAFQPLEPNPRICRPTINAVAGSGRFRWASTLAPRACVASMPRTTQRLVRDVLAGLDVTDTDPQAIHPQAFHIVGGQVGPAFRVVETATGVPAQLSNPGWLGSCHRSTSMSAPPIRGANFTLERLQTVHGRCNRD